MNFASNSRELYQFVIGELRTDGWVSDWRKEQERRRAEDVRTFVTAPQIKARQERVIIKKFCDGCGKGVKSNTKSGLCHPCSRKRAKCACGRTVYNKGISATQCRECFHRGNRKVCALCPAMLNASTACGLCKIHYRKYRHFIHQEEKVKCSDCDTMILKKNRFGKCMKHAKNLYNQTYRDKARELKAAA